jgi:hypothetical protein
MSSGGRWNPWRALNPRAFDRGARINQRAVELQRIAVKGMTESDALTALAPRSALKSLAWSLAAPRF